MKQTGAYAVRYERVSMAQLALTLERPFQPQQVVDGTGLPGRFDFALDLAPYVLDAGTGQPVLNATGGIDESGALIQALPRQLGLRIEKKLMPTEVLVIDRLDKDPTAN